MGKNTVLKDTFILLLSSFALTFALGGCKKDIYNNFEKPPVSSLQELPEATMTIKQLKEHYKRGGTTIDFFGITPIIQGRVISSDRSGNFYNELYIQDETGGIKISIGSSALYTLYPLGVKVALKCQGLRLGAYGGSISIGVESSSDRYENDRIPYPLLSECLLVSDDIAPVVPVVLSIDQMGREQDGMFVRVENAQFADNALGSTWAEEGSNANRDVITQSGEKIVVRSSGYASFAGETLPEGSGTIEGIFTMFNQYKQLKVNGSSSARFTSPRFKVAMPGAEEIPVVNSDIATLRKKFQGETVQISDELVFRASVISSDESGNIYKKLYLQDEKGDGMAISVDNNKIWTLYPVGTKVVVKAKGLYLGSYHGEFILGAAKDDRYGVTRISSEGLGKALFTEQRGEPLAPMSMALDKVSPQIWPRWVKLSGLTPKAPNTPWYQGSGSHYNQIFTDSSGREIIVRTSQYAKFAKENVPSGTLTITGVLSGYNKDSQLLLNTAKDVVVE